MPCASGALAEGELMDGSTGIGPLDTVAVWATAVAAVAGLCALGWRVAHRARRVARRIEEFIDDWQGVEARAGVEGRAGVMERLAAIEHRVAAIVHEVRPNNGSSLRDAVNRVDRRTATIVGDDDHEDPQGGPHVTGSEGS
jgi:hypothetical protein